MRWLAIAMLLSAPLATTAEADSVRLDPAVAANVLAIHARDPELRDDAFAKMGGSSVASKAFLYCFATPYVDLGDHPDLQETIDHFRTGRRNSFNRQSLAAGVSWNLRYALGGRPAHFREEIDATDARWALVFFGGNDAQNQNERIYARRLVYLVEELAAMGVVPVLGSASPRRNKTKDRWIQRFNAITQAVAAHWQLPYVDYHEAMTGLPRKGLARDGVHPNVPGKGGVRRACQLTERGLRYGNNLRNFLTLQMLDALRRIVAGTGTDTGTDTDTDADTGTDTGADTGTDADTALSVHDLPFSVVVEKDALGVEEIPPGCSGLKPGAPAYRVSVSVEEPTRLRITALDLDRYQPRVFWVRVGEDDTRCVKRRNQTLEVAVRPGLWDLIVQASERAAQDGKMLVLIDRNPR
ncbi:MAG: SGNH/GDSL hydrolase family protein [Myxococcales bacterium]|nr:SGNH/GDSL hydrolase family protein [Myxococcales bacterium]